MRSNLRDKVNINIPLPPPLHEKLVNYERASGFRTHLSFIEAAVEEPLAVKFDFFEINGLLREEASALFRLGDFVYRWNGQTFIPLGEEACSSLIASRES